MTSALAGWNYNSNSTALFPVAIRLRVTGLSQCRSRNTLVLHLASTGGKRNQTDLGCSCRGKPQLSPDWLCGAIKTMQPLP